MNPQQEINPQSNEPSEMESDESSVSSNYSTSQTSETSSSPETHARSVSSTSRESVVLSQFETYLYENDGTLKVKTILCTAAVVIIVSILVVRMLRSNKQ